MNNRAKCKLCNSVIESFHAADYVECKCGEIAVYDGEAMRCAAKDFGNFLRIDEKGNVINVSLFEKKGDEFIVPLPSQPSKAELLNMLDGIIESIERLPDEAKRQPVDLNYFASFVALLSSILRS